MRIWLLTPKGKGRSLNSKFILNWLNKIEKPLIIENNKEKYYRDHIGNWACRICGKSYSQESNIKTHIKEHDNIT